MALDGFVASAGSRLQCVPVANQQRSAARLEDAFALEGLDDPAGVAAANTQHEGELLMRERHEVVASSIHGRDDPFGRSLLDRMDSVAGGRLEHLRQQAVRVAGEEMAQRQRFQFRGFEIPHSEADEGTAELNDDLGISWKIAVAHDSSDCALAADQNRLDVMAVLVGHEKRDETRSTGKIDHVDIVAGAVQELVGGTFPLLEVRLEQRIVAWPQGPQQVVDGGIISTRGRFDGRWCHGMARKESANSTGCVHEGRDYRPSL